MCDNVLTVFKQNTFSLYGIAGGRSYVGTIGGVEWVIGEVPQDYDEFDDSDEWKSRWEVDGDYCRDLTDTPIDGFVWNETPQDALEWLCQWCEENPYDLDNE